MRNCEVQATSHAIGWCCRASTWCILRNNCVPIAQLLGLPRVLGCPASASTSVFARRRRVTLGRPFRPPSTPRVLGAQRAPKGMQQISADLGTRHRSCSP